MDDPTLTQTVLFPDLVAKLLVATFDQPEPSSDGGAILLKAADRRLGLIDTLAGVLSDAREATRVRHSMRDLLAQGIFGLACGHADANDAEAWAAGPVHKLVLDRDPIDGPRLALLTLGAQVVRSVRRSVFQLPAPIPTSTPGAPSPSSFAPSFADPSCSLDFPNTAPVSPHDRRPGPRAVRGGPELGSQLLPLHAMPLDRWPPPRGAPRAAPDLSVKAPHEQSALTLRLARRRSRGHRRRSGAGACSGSLTSAPTPRAADR